LGVVGEARVDPATAIMKYKFKIIESGKESEEKEAMSYKKVLKSLITPNPKWTGTISYVNKKKHQVLHNITQGRRTHG